MQFTIANIDMDCSTSNPWVASALGLCALGFGACIATILASRQPMLRKAILGALAFGASIVGSHAAQYFGVRLETLMFHDETGSIPGAVQYGCIGRPPSYLAPTATLV